MEFVINAIWCFLWSFFLGLSWGKAAKGATMLSALCLAAAFTIFAVGFKKTQDFAKQNPLQSATAISIALCSSVFCYAYSEASWGAFHLGLALALLSAILVTLMLEKVGVVGEFLTKNWAGVWFVVSVTGIGLTVIHGWGGGLLAAFIMQTAISGIIAFGKTKETLAICHKILFASGMMSLLVWAAIAFVIAAYPMLANPHQKVNSVQAGAMLISMLLLIPGAIGLVSWLAEGKKKI